MQRTGCKLVHIKKMNKKNYICKFKKYKISRYTKKLVHQTGFKLGNINQYKPYCKVITISNRIKLSNH